MTDCINTSTVQSVMTLNELVDVEFKPKPEKSTTEGDESENDEQIRNDEKSERPEKPGSTGLTTSVSANFNQLNPDIVHALFKNSKE